MDLAALLPLRTERLTLRLFTGEDVDAMYAYQRLPEVARYLFRPPRDRSRCAEVIAADAVAPKWEADGESLVLAVCLGAGPEGALSPPIGEVVLKCASVRARQAEIGWVLHPAHAGHGYATEGARALAALAFDTLGAHRLFARLDQENAASARVCERLGMRHEALLVENDLDGDRWANECVYGALSHDLVR